MGTSLIDNFDYRGRRFLDSRQSVATLSDLRAVAESAVPDGFRAYCAETALWYEYNSANPTDPSTGRWRAMPTEIAQQPGDRTDIPMSQKAVKEAIESEIENTITPRITDEADTVPSNKAVKEGLTLERLSRIQLEEQDNFLNPNSPGVLKGYFLGSNGGERVNEIYNISDYIPLAVDETLYIQNTGASSSTSICYYDSDFNFMAAIPGNSTEVPGLEGCAYVRFSYSASAPKPFVTKSPDVEYSPFDEYAPILRTVKEETEKCTRQHAYARRIDDYEEEIIRRGAYSGRIEYLGNKNYNGWGLLFTEEYSGISFNAIRLVALGHAKNLRLIVGYLKATTDGSKPEFSDMVTLVEQDFTELNNTNSGKEITVIFDDIFVPQGSLLYIGYESDTYGLGAPVSAYTGAESYRAYSVGFRKPAIADHTGPTESYNYFYAVPLSVHAEKIEGPYMPDKFIVTDMLADEAVDSRKIRDGAIITEKLASNVVTNEKIADKTICIDKLSIAESRNLFNPHDEDIAEERFLNLTTGNPTGVNEIYVTTGFMMLPDGASGKYAVASVNGIVITSRFIGFYDSEKRTITVLENSKNPQIPEGAVYIRTSFSNNYNLPLAERGYMLEVSGDDLTQTTYTPYRKSILPEYLPMQKAEFVNELAMPLKLYMLDGIQNDMYIDTFIKSWRPYMEYVRMAASSGMNFSRTWQRVYSITSPVDNGRLSIYLKDYATADVLSEITAEICSARPSEGDDEVVVQVIGDSYTNGGWFVNALVHQGFVPGIKCVGLRRQGNTDVYDEGRGGWKLSDYMSAPKDNSSNPYNGFMHPAGDFRYYGSTEFWISAWKVKRGTAGSEFEPTYSCGRFGRCLDLFDETSGLLSNPRKGDVQKDSGTGRFIMWDGTSWVDVEELQWEFDYSKYLAMWNIEPPKFLAVMLGVNDFIGAKRPISFSGWNGMMQTVIDSYHRAVPDGLFIICTPTTYFGTLDNSSNADVVNEHLNMWLGRKNIIDTFDGREDEGIYIVDTALMCDSLTGDNGAFKDMAHPLCSPQNDVKVFEQSGLPHPYVNYKSLGIPLAALIHKYR